jgi:hypothetical protein
MGEANHYLEEGFTKDLEDQQEGWFVETVVCVLALAAAIDIVCVCTGRNAVAVNFLFGEESFLFGTPKPPAAARDDPFARDQLDRANKTWRKTTPMKQRTPTKVRFEEEEDDDEEGEEDKES